MTVRDLREQVELQGKIKYVEYDYERDFYTIVDIIEAIDRDIKYIYTQDESIILELETKE